jgi:serine protease AprX
MAKITINGVTMDPLAQAPALAAANLHAADAAASNYILIQTKQPLDKAQKAELAGKGVAILDYVPDDTYLCHFPQTNLTDIRALPYVAWANVYLKAFKVPPTLSALPPGPNVRDILEMAVRPGRVLDDALKTVDVVLHDDVVPTSMRDKVAAAAGIDAADLKLSRHKIRLKIQLRNLSVLAALDEVRHVEEVFPAQLHNDVARQILRIGIPTGNPGTVLEGEGQIVAVADTGFDKGSTTDVHPAFQGRVVKLYALGRPGKTNDPHGHGTHVAGSVLGDGTSTILGFSVRGTAPKARLVLQSTLDAAGGLGGLPDDLDDLFLPPYRDDGARIHTNSWGSTRPGGRYDSQCKELDDFVWQHRDCVICFAAGNDGIDNNTNGQIDLGSVSPPGSAKNCITVGATENNRPTVTDTYGQGWPSDFPTDPIASDRMADNPEGMVAFSSRGPTLAQRIKPDVVAPGTFILSSRSRDTSSRGWGLPEDLGLPADHLYFFDGGTSMATPLVAGCVAVVREYLIKQKHLSQPSAALIKAMLLNGAHNSQGQYTPSEAGLIPNNSEGFGRVDVAATIGPYAASESVTLKDEATALDTNEEERTTVTIGTNPTTLKVTLVWTDPPGDALQNDLDLIVRAANNQERHGNIPATSTAFDRRNNVEQVVWTGVPTGNVDIIVRANRISQQPQSYALVIRQA